MAISSLLALCLQTPVLQEPVVPMAAPQVPSPDFMVAPLVLEGTRIALSPILDGRQEEEEWDPFITEGDGRTYFQWQPGALHLAARTVPGTEVVASFDLANDGWLKGRDNVEVRIAPDGTVKSRLLDATPISGPVWIDNPNFAASTKVAPGLDFVEASVSDPGVGLIPEKQGAKIGVRIDLVPVEKADIAPYLPRVCAPVTLSFSRAAGLPVGLSFEPENESKSVVPGQTVRLRFTFKGQNDLNLLRIVLRSEGAARAVTSLLELPFPRLDRKGRAFVDYDTPVALGASVGYRLARGTLTSTDGIPSVMQVSYRIAQPIDVQMILDKMATPDMDRSVKRNYYLRSNSGKGVNGRVSIEVAAPLRVLNGNERPVYLGSSRGRTRQGFDLLVPGGTKGTYPVSFRFKVGDSEYVQTQYVTIG